MKDFARLLPIVCVLGFMLPACTATYMEAEVQAGEAERNAHDRAEEERDREIGEEGGFGMEQIDEQIDEAVRESEL